MTGTNLYDRTQRLLEKRDGIIQVSAIASVIEVDEGSTPEVN
jgi:hypothetical protein